jgi:hypothetical protein
MLKPRSPAGVAKTGRAFASLDLFRIAFFKVGVFDHQNDFFEI